MTGSNGFYTIPPGAAFVDALAAGVMKECGGDPLALARYTILLPTRRACRALREGFLRVTEGRPLLLPRLQALGDVEAETELSGEVPGIDTVELPPAISEPRRLLLLARRILDWNAELDGERRTEMTPDHAVRLAGELARLIDRVQTERLSFDALAGLAPLELARHWEQTLAFLELVTAHWPPILEAEGCLDPADRRNRLLDGSGDGVAGAAAGGAGDRRRFDRQRAGDGGPVRGDCRAAAGARRPARPRLRCGRRELGRDPAGPDASAARHGAAAEAAGGGSRDGAGLAA